MTSTQHTSTDLLTELQARHLIHQCTDEPGLREHLNSSRTLYCGLDPSADSLTIGNLVPLMLLRRFKAAGHTPIVLSGGATGRIGDPSGKDAERSLMTDEQVEANIDAQRPIFQSILGDDVQIVDNYSWFKDITFLGALRDIGKHFSVNQMVKRDAVRNRLEREDQGISYTEFSYMLLQAYDFLHLFREHNVTIQAAGADQWGNIVSGTDLIRRVESVNKYYEEWTEADQAIHDRVLESCKRTNEAGEVTVDYSEVKRQLPSHIREKLVPPAVFGLTAPLLTK